MPLKYVARALMNVNFYQKFAVFTQSAAVWPRAAPLKQLRWMKRNPRIYPEHGRLQGNLFSPKLPFKKKNSLECHQFVVDLLYTALPTAAAAAAAPPGHRTSHSTLIPLSG